MLGQWGSSHLDDIGTIPTCETFKIFFTIMFGLYINKDLLTVERCRISGTI